MTDTGEPSWKPEYERSLIASTKVGDKAAFEQLVQNYDERLLRHLSKLSPRAVGPELHDIAQDTWIRVFAALRTGRFDSSTNRGSFLNFLFQEAATVVSEASRRHRVEFAEHDLAAIPKQSEADPLERKEELDQLLLLRSQLSDEERELFDLIRSSDMTSSQLANSLQIEPKILLDRRIRLMDKLNNLRAKLKDLSRVVVTHPPYEIPTGSELYVFVDPGDAPASLIAELYVALSNLYRANGGSGLTIAKEERRSLVPEVLS